MRPLRYAINVTLDGCCHHEAGVAPDEESMRFWTAQMEHADAEIYGRATYQMMESAWRRPVTGVWPDWMREWEIPFAEAIDAKRKYVVSVVAGHGPTLLSGLRERIELELVERQDFRSGVTALRYRLRGA